MFYHSLSNTQRSIRPSSPARDFKTQLHIDIKPINQINQSNKMQPQLPAKNLSHISKDVLINTLHPYLNHVESARLNAVSRFFHKNPATLNLAQAKIILNKKIEVLFNCLSELLKFEAPNLRIPIGRYRLMADPTEELMRVIITIRESNNFQSACSSRMKDTPSQWFAPAGLVGGMFSGIYFGMVAFPSLTGCGCSCCFGMLFGVVGALCVGPCATGLVANTMSSLNSVRLSYQIQNRLAQANRVYALSASVSEASLKSDLQKFEKDINTLLAALAGPVKAIPPTPFSPMIMQR